ncbi:MAG: T9SS type A sorting domain-containing protein [Bacteroidales bacterium]|nr:T9SS type A sorting domain-containing protein [Bacteroidales bacterium]
MRIKTILSFAVVLFFQLQILKAQKPDISVYRFRDSAMCSAWSPYDSTLVGYALIKNGYYQAYLANVGPNNTRVNERCFSCSNSSLPGKSVSGPVFDPLGRYLLFAVEMANHPGTPGNSIPGIGSYNDLYVVTTNGNKTYKLTNMPNTGISAIIFPSFSPNGKEIMWAQMTDAVNGADCVLPIGKLCFGGWAVKIAAFVDDTVNGPYLANIRTITPGGIPAFNEPYGWSPNGSKIIFASDYNQVWVWADQIYSMDTLGNNIQQLTTTGGSVGWPYCEHAFSSPDGQHIVWMTNREGTSGSSKGGDDWWIMNSDGSSQQRLTYFNDTLSSYWTGTVHVNGFGCFSPNSKKFIGDVGGPQPVQLDSAALNKSFVYIITLDSLATVEEKNAGMNKSECFVYPNPAIDNLRVLVKNNTGKIEYSVFNILGKKISNGDFSGEILDVNVKGFSGGLYFLKLSDGKTVVNKRFLVVKN